MWHTNMSEFLHFSGCIYIFAYADIPLLRSKNKFIAEKNRECHNHKPQVTHDMKRKRTEIIKARNINKQMHEKHLVNIIDVTCFFIG